MRRFTILGGVAAALGAGVLLSACSPVQMGAAAIVGNQRITTSTLDTQASNLQKAVSRYPSGQVQMTSAQMPKAVLGWLVKFAIEDRAAKSAGISVTSSQVQQGIASIEEQAKQYAEQSGLSSPAIVLLSSGIAPQMMENLGKYQAQELLLATKANGGKLPTSQAEDKKVSAALTRSSCLAAKSLNIRINPKYGRLDYSQYTVVAGPDLLSKPEGASPVPMNNAKPSC
ncbi:MAG: SurA N-terminal domain-containing protein [Nocardiopsaceae bacterium]|nr:SurA N-terminal domain-containing protein [Nocardiopsaceae bacterium]